MSACFLYFPEAPKLPFQMLIEDAAAAPEIDGRLALQEDRPVFAFGARSGHALPEDPVNNPMGLQYPFGTRSPLQAVTRQSQCVGWGREIRQESMMVAVVFYKSCA